MFRIVFVGTEPGKTVVVPFETLWNKIRNTRERRVRGVDVSGESSFTM